MALDLALELAPIAAARLTPDAIALFALDAVPGRVYELPRVVRQALILEGAEEVTLRIAIGSRDLYRFHSSLESPMASGKSGWVDEVSVRAAELDAPRGHLLAAWKAVTLQSSQAAAPIRLPVGSYWIQPLECSFGWWMEQLDLEVDGGPIVLRPYRTPIVRIISPLDLEHARVEKVALLFDRQDGVTAKTRGEIEVPWRESGAEVEASMYWRASDERGMLYAIRVYWDSGEERTSSLVSWTALEGPVPLLE